MSLIKELLDMSFSSRVIAVANHKGGCGKTTTVVNLAAEFTKLGMKVLVIDLDPQENASIHVGLQHPSEVDVSVRNLLIREYHLGLGLDELIDKAIKPTHFVGMDLIYGSLSLTIDKDKIKDKEVRPYEVLKNITNKLKERYDVILIDTPPSLEVLTSNALAAATDYIVPLISGNPYGLYGVNELQNYIEVLRQINPELNLLGGLLLRHDERQILCKMNKEDFNNLLGKVIPIHIPHSVKIDQAATLNTSVGGLDSHANVARRYRELAEYLAKEMEFVSPVA